MWRLFSWRRVFKNYRENSISKRKKNNNKKKKKKKKKKQFSIVSKRTVVWIRPIQLIICFLFLFVSMSVIASVSLCHIVAFPFQSFPISVPLEVCASCWWHFLDNFRSFLGNFNYIFHSITKTYLYNVDPLKSTFIQYNWGLQGIDYFLISAQKHRLWYSLEPPRRGGSNEYPQSMFWT